MITAMATNASVARFLNHWKKWAGGIVLLAMVGIVAGIIVATFHYRPALAKWLEYTMVMGNSVISPGTRVFRDAMVALAAVIGIAIAVWRAIMLDRQTKTGEERLLRERFATAAGLMAQYTTAGPAIAARISGIYIMADLAKEEPKRFAELVVKNLIAYIIDNVQKTGVPLGTVNQGGGRDICQLGKDIITAFAVIDTILANEDAPDISEDVLDFSRQDFSYLDFHAAQINMSPYKWKGVDFESSYIPREYIKEKNIPHGQGIPVPTE